MSVNNFFKIIKNHIVVIVAFVITIVTIFFIPINKSYLQYFDFRTLSCLFLVSLIISACKEINIFFIVAKNIIINFKKFRICYIILISITFIGSMVIANDMALITFLPLGYIILKQSKNEQYEAFVFVMQNISANLGGMLTPFGNPQNLYIYNKFNIAVLDFMLIMLIPFTVSIVLILLTSFFIPNVELNIENEKVKTNKIKIIIYLLLFIFAIFIIFRMIKYIYGLIIIPILIFILDKKAFKNVDYQLLITFCLFFIFAGNMSKIDLIKNFFVKCLNINPLLTTIVSCQIISNVPTSILMSQFTNNYKALLYGVNIGGLGTLIASLASLITFFEYKKEIKNQALFYLKIFTTINLLFLTVLYILCFFLLKKIP